MSASQEAETSPVRGRSPRFRWFVLSCVVLYYALYGVGAFLIPSERSSLAQSALVLGFALLTLALGEYRSRGVGFSWFWLRTSTNRHRPARPCAGLAAVLGRVSWRGARAARLRLRPSPNGNGRVRWTGLHDRSRPLLARVPLWTAAARSPSLGLDVRAEDSSGVDLLDVP